MPCNGCTHWIRHSPTVLWPALVLTALAAAALPSPAASPGVFSVRDYGAAGDGRTLDTAAINKAVQACSAAGGGQVLLPPGKYLSGTVHLKSNITLRLDAGARLVGSTDLEHYQNFTPPPDAPEAKWLRWHRALILGDGVENVALIGPGTIDGNKVFDPKGEERMRGPHTVLLGNSRGIAIRDLSIVDSANYAVMLEFCQQVEVRGVKITGGWDGVHFRGWPGRPCRDVSIVNCQFFTGDDSIAGRYWENVLVSGCVVNSSCNGIRLIGPAEHLIVHDCLFYGPGLHEHRTSGSLKRKNMLAGIILQPGAWDATKGRLDDVLISDVTMKDVTTPLSVTVKPGNTVGRIVVSHLTALGVYRAASSVESWAETPIEEMVLRDASIEYEGGGMPPQGRTSIRSPGVDTRPLPAWGFYARNVKHLLLENVRLGCAKDDLRPVMICDDVERLDLDGFRFSQTPAAPIALALNNVARLDARDAGISMAGPQYVDVKLTPESPSGPLRAGKPYSATVTVENSGGDGLRRVELSLAGRKAARWVWLKPNEKKEVVFQGLTAPEAGTHQLRAGGLTRTVLVEPAPENRQPKKP
jgi:hypothetical protein